MTDHSTESGQEGVYSKLTAGHPFSNLYGGVHWIDTEHEYISSLHRRNERMKQQKTVTVAGTGV